MHNFRELEVWKKAIDLTTQFYKFSKLYPKDELFGLTSQSRRCMVSIASILQKEQVEIPINNLFNF
jgi:hypothetical protein